MTGLDKIQALVQRMNGKDEGFGTLSDDVETRLGFVDDELMKRGTLNATSMDAAGIVENCLAILETCTHMAAFRGLVIALPAVDPGQGLESALVLAKELFSTHWPDLFPTGKANARRRKAWANDIVTALEQGVDRAIKQNGDLSEPCRAALEDFLQAGAKADLDLSKLSKLSNRETTTDQAEAADGQTDDTGSATTRLDARGRADLRRDIRAIADRINQFHPNEAVAYRLRGYAAWLEFRFLPEAKADGVTQMQSMPAFIHDEHKKNIAQPTPAKLAKLEDRLFMSPDWFEGQHMACDMATKLSWPQVASAIRTRTHQRLAEFEGLKALKYANGRPFVSEEIEDWLNERPKRGPEPARKKSGDKANIELMVLLEDLNGKLGDTKSPRSRMVIKLEVAQAMRAAGLSDQADMMFEEIKQQMISLHVDTWDTELFAQVS